MTDYRKKCLEQKGEMCALCTSEQNIEVHHIDGDRTNNDISNLLPVCDDCHKQIHTNGGEYQQFTEQVERNLSVSLSSKQEEMLQKIAKTERGFVSTESGLDDVLKSIIESYFETVADHRVEVSENKLKNLINHAEPIVTETEQGESVVVETRRWRDVGD